MTRQAGAIIFPKRFLPKERWDENVIAQAKADIEKDLLIAVGQLVGKSYLVAETFMLADLCYLPFLEFLPLMETPPANVAAWAQRLLSRASALETKPNQ